MGKRLTPERLEELLQHVWYEVWMLHQTYGMLQIPVPAQSLANVFIEAFCLHARNLIEFFHGYRDEKPTMFVGSAFTINEKAVDKRYYILICEQISHITFNRTKDQNKKINIEDRNTMFRQLLAEVDRFEKNLKPKYAALWAANKKTGITLDAG